ncbi:transposase [Streptomyces sp. NPDC051172]|uniref:transposase n=1 Tax=Streptomyces sp. NPDC051172 TaxID=3155796 RepID=UPI003420E5B8
MESMGKKKPRPRRSLTPEFKAETVELCRRGDRSVGQIAKDFDLTETAVRLWVSQAEVDAGERDGLTRSEREEPAALRRENRRLREDVEVLKQALTLQAPRVRRRRRPGHHDEPAALRLVGLGKGLASPGRAIGRGPARIAGG